MKTSRTLLVVLCAAGALLLLQGTSESKAAAVAYTIDPDHSAIVFRISHVGISNTYGRFNKLAGELAFAEGGGGSSISVTVEAASVDTNQAKRDNHLRSPDFLSVKEFPTITFKSKAWEEVDDGEYEITGDLTLHGVTREVVVEAEKVGEGKGPYGKHRIGFEGELKIDRTEFGMKKMVGPVGEEVELIIAIEGIRK